MGWDEGTSTAHAAAKQGQDLRLPDLAHPSRDKGTRRDALCFQSGRLTPVRNWQIGGGAEGRGRGGRCQAGAERMARGFVWRSPKKI